MISTRHPFSTRKRTLSDDVYDALLDDIVTGELTPGERLREAQVAESLGVSRTPVREALTRLQDQHFVDKDGSGAYLVAGWDRQILWEVATMRGALEGLCVKLAVQNLAPEDIDYLLGLVTQMEGALERNDFERLINLDLQFHSRIWSRAGHRILQEALEQLKPQVRYWMYLTRPDEERDYPEEHRALIEVFRLRDAELAVAAIEKHSYETIERALVRLGIGDAEEPGQSKATNAFRSMG